MKGWIAIGAMCVVGAMPAGAQSVAQSGQMPLWGGAASSGPSIENAMAMSVPMPVAMAAAAPAAPALPDTPPASELPKWEFWFGYQGERYEEFRGGAVGNAISDYDFWTFGPNFTITRFLNKWLGIDAGATPSWGHTTAGSHLVTQGFDFGIGPRLALRGRHRLEPFVRTSVGMLHFHFDNSGALPQTLNSFQYTAGAGSGFKLTKRIWWSLEVDYMGTHFFSNNQKDVLMRTQVVFNF